ncbi:MAG: flavodoxin-dependent (E)-4-hydroxy-3-methylbut-2-enyl-diphosphate synthase, partial [Gammaproteobacteria bacterium]|nr:flavodoxin-dependent (E)-4-hydroxy-3-methylbut-2-enyl-diphosphate synthase [Gammaproteobacteria bacterium]
MHCESPITRRVSRKIWVGSVPVGGDAPIAVQSMTNTDTNDVAATVAQVRRLQDAGADIVRISVPDMDAAEAFGRIKQQVSVPLVADIHFDYQIALRVAELGVDCLRINPGNIGREDRVRGGGRGGARQRHSDSYRGECRFAGKGFAEEIWRADS